MNPKLHLGLMVFFEFFGFVAGAIIGIVLFVQQVVTKTFFINALLIGGLIGIGVMVPRLIFRHLIGTRCTVEACGGSAFPFGKNPIRYRCKRCGHEWETNVSEGPHQDWRDDRLQ